MYPSGVQCSKPVARYLDPPLCGGHCDSINVPIEQTPLDKSDDGLSLGDPTENVDSNPPQSEDNKADCVIDSEVKR